jgi:hypothetical protein
MLTNQLAYAWNVSLAGCHLEVLAEGTEEVEVVIRPRCLEWA